MHTDTATTAIIIVAPVVGALIMIIMLVCCCRLFREDEADKRLERRERRSRSARSNIWYTSSSESVNRNDCYLPGSISESSFQSSCTCHTNFSDVEVHGVPAFDDVSFNGNEHNHSRELQHNGKRRCPRTGNSDYSIDTAITSDGSHINSTC